MTKIKVKVLPVENSGDSGSKGLFFFNKMELNKGEEKQQKTKNKK